MALTRHYCTSTRGSRRCPWLGLITSCCCGCALLLLLLLFLLLALALLLALLLLGFWFAGRRLGLLLLLRLCMQFKCCAEVQGGQVVLVQLGMDGGKQVQQLQPTPAHRKTTPAGHTAKRG